MSDRLWEKSHKTKPKAFVTGHSPAESGIVGVYSMYGTSTKACWLGLKSLVFLVTNLMLW